MYSFDIVTHPTEIEPLIKNGSVRVLSSTNSGPIGMMRYKVETNLRDEVLSLEAEPLKFSVLTHLLEKYNEKHLEYMCDAYFQMMLGVMPERYETYTYANHRLTYKYPVYDGEYLYVREQEKYYLQTDIYNMLGYFPLHTDPLMFKAGLPTDYSILWGTACVVESTNTTPDTMYQADEARRLMEFNRRIGYSSYYHNVGVSGDAISGYTYEDTTSSDSIYHDRTKSICKYNMRDIEEVREMEREPMCSQCVR